VAAVPSSAVMSDGVDAWFAAKDPPRAETMQHVRRLILDADELRSVIRAWCTAHE
jgi:hypothetical protein